MNNKAGKMSTISLVALLLMVTVARSAVLPGTNDLDSYKGLLADLSAPSAAKGTKLMWDVARVVATYLCSVEAKNCEAMKEYLEEEDLEENMSADQDLEDSLISKADQIMNESSDNFLMLDEVRLVLIKMICSSEPAECPFWRLETGYLQ